MGRVWGQAGSGGEWGNAYLGGSPESAWVSPTLQDCPGRALHKCFEVVHLPLLPSIPALPAAHSPAPAGTPARRFLRIVDRAVYRLLPRQRVVRHC